MRIKIVMLLMFFAAGLLTAQDANQIIKKAEDTIKGESAQGRIEMTIHTPDYTRTLRMDSWWEGDNALIIIEHPPKEAGNKTLKIGNEMWNYLSNTETTIKIPPSMMLRSWNGSDFTNDDIVRESDYAEDYNTEITGTEEIEGETCWKINMIPKEDAPVVWGRLVYWVRKKDNLPARVNYYDEKDKLIRHMVFSEVKKMGNRTIPAKWKMISDTDPEKYTTMELLSMRFDVDIPDRKFSFQELERGSRR